MAKERMKWKSTPGLMGTSENLTPLKSAPMYSLKRLEAAGAAADGVESRTERRRRAGAFLKALVAELVEDCLCI